MLPINATELTRMRMAQTDAMLDACVILTYAEGARNEFNEADAPTYTAGDPTRCGLDMRPGSERHGAEMTVVQFDATLRLPIFTPLKETDRVQINTRFGEPCDPLTYAIVAPIQRGPSGIRILLRQATV